MEALLGVRLALKLERSDSLRSSIESQGSIPLVRTGFRIEATHDQ